MTHMITCPHPQQCGAQHHIPGSTAAKNCQKISTQPTQKSSTNPLTDLPTCTTMTEQDHHIIQEYAIWRFLTNTLHNSSREAQQEEIQYYGTASGQLELQRRLRQKEYITELIYDQIQPVSSPKKLLDDNDMKTFNDLADRGQSRIGEEDIDRNDREISAWLLRESLSWLNDLSAEEIEAVSWFTSNGSTVMRGQWTGAGKTPYNTEALLSALDKSSSTETLTLWRGTSQEFISGDINQEKNSPCPAIIFRYPVRCLIE